jgi:hypothetical protein
MPFQFLHWVCRRIAPPRKSHNGAVRCSFQILVDLCDLSSERYVTSRTGGYQEAGASVLATSYKNHVTTRPALAAKMATTVAQPRMFSGVAFTLSPMIDRLLVISMMSKSRGGVENPCTTLE